MKDIRSNINYTTQITSNFISNFHQSDPLMFLLLYNKTYYKGRIALRGSILVSSVCSKKLVLSKREDGYANLTVSGGYTKLMHPIVFHTFTLTKWNNKVLNFLSTTLILKRKSLKSR